MPPITELTRIEPVLIERLDHQGIFTTGLLLEVSETPTRRQTLADQVKTDVTDVLEWRDEALMLNLASFGPDEHLMMIQARIEGLRDILDLELDAFRSKVVLAAARAGHGRADRPDHRRLVGPGTHPRGRVDRRSNLVVGRPGAPERATMARCVAFAAASRRS